MLDRCFSSPRLRSLDPKIAGSSVGILSWTPLRDGEFERILDWLCVATLLRDATPITLKDFCLTLSLDRNSLPPKLGATNYPISSVLVTFKRNQRIM
jgi:hypothetical protein